MNYFQKYLFLPKDLYSTFLLKSNMRKELLILSFCFILIYSCGPSDNPYDNLDYRSGTQGLEVVFATDAPPSKVYSGSFLNMVLEVKNKGAFNIENTNAKVYLTGYDPTAIKFEGFDNKNKYKKITGHAIVKISGKELSLIVNSIKTIINNLQSLNNQNIAEYSQILNNFENIKAEYDKKEKAINIAKKLRRK